MSRDSSLLSFAPLILIFVIFYFLIIRPQSKKIKDLRLMVDNLKIGDRVITNSGILGVVKGLNKNDGHVELEIANGVNVVMLKSSISDLLKKKDKETKVIKTKKEHQKK